MRTYEIKITGSGTLNQITVRLQEILRELQIEEVYHSGGLCATGNKTFKDDILMCKIEEEYNSIVTHE